MAFTDVEMAILAQLAYSGAAKELNPGNAKVPISTEPKTRDNLFMLLTENENWLIHKLGDSYKPALEKLMEKVKDQDFSIALAEDDDQGTGFAAIAIKDPENNITVAARGTEGFSMDFDSRKDVLADIELALLISNSQQKKMEAFMSCLESEGYDGYYFTGHSLGGNLALYAAITFNNPEKVKGVVTFNAPGYNEAFLAKYLTAIGKLKGKITNFQNKYDYVSSIMFTPGTIKIVDSSKQDKHYEFGDHMLNALTLEGESFALSEIQEKSKTTEIGHYLIEYVRKPFRELQLFVGTIEILFAPLRFATESIDSFFKNFVNNVFDSSKVVVTSLIKVDTGSLESYANRLSKVNLRIKKLDERLDNLYKNVGLKDLWSLIQADILTGYSKKLKKNQNYLIDTANDFISIENKIKNLI